MHFFRLYKQGIIRTAAIVAAVGAVLMLVVIPQRKNLKARKIQLAAVSADVTRRMTEIEELEKIVNEERAAKDFVIGAAGDILPTLLEILAELGERHKVEILSMKPSNLEETVLLTRENVNIKSKKLVISMKVRAFYRDLGEYFKSLEEIHVLVAVKDLRMMKTGPESRLLDADFLIETYSLQDET